MDLSEGKMDSPTYLKTYAYKIHVAMLNMHGFWYPVSILSACSVPTAKDQVLLYHEFNQANRHDHVIDSTTYWDLTVYVIEWFAT